MTHNDASLEARVIAWFNSLSPDVQWDDLEYDWEREGAFEAYLEEHEA